MARSAAFAVALILAFASQASADAINITSLRSIDSAYCVTGSCVQTFTDSTDASGTVSMADFDIVVTPSTQHEFSASQTTHLDASGAAGVMSATASTITNPSTAPTAGSIGDSRLSFSFEVPTRHTFSFAATLSAASTTGAFTTEAASHFFSCDPLTSICDGLFSFRDDIDDATSSLFSTMGVLLPGLSYHFLTIVTATADAGPGFPFDNIEFASANADFTFTLAEEAAAVPEPSTLLLVSVGVVGLKWRARKDSNLRPPA